MMKRSAKVPRKQERMARRWQGSQPSGHAYRKGRPAFRKRKGGGRNLDSRFRGRTDYFFLFLRAAYFASRAAFFSASVITDADAAASALALAASASAFFAALASASA